MFSGIVAATGRITHIAPLEQGVRLTVDTDGLGLDDVIVGDSIANNGVCLTVVGIDGRHALFDVSKETLACTVSGHVDGVGVVRSFTRIGESHELVIVAPRPLARYIARKGSITVQGVSLTVNRVTDVDDGCEFSINLIPHTVAVTTLRALAAGSRVNLEIDLIARYAERMMAAGDNA